MCLFCLKDPAGCGKLGYRHLQALNPSHSHSPEELVVCSALFYKHRIKAQKSKVICSKPCRESLIEQKRSQQQIKKYFSKNKALKIHKGNVARTKCSVTIKNAISHY